MANETSSTRAMARTGGGALLVEWKRCIFSLRKKQLLEICKIQLVWTAGLCDSLREQPSTSGSRIGK
ncbi:hypothetical protein U9M48_025672 [Paspalum notatum var. saurae]|uniref:Uncharacterized protein n=1 Tax=Paspalum notatum var. saurae TaxID=547442 RepID=A0AAQ3TP94_PASNO